MKSWHRFHRRNMEHVNLIKGLAWLYRWLDKKEEKKEPVTVAELRDKIGAILHRI